MASGIASYASPAQRIGRIKGATLKHSLQVSTLEISGDVYKEPVKMGDTVIFRQVVPYGATAAAPDVLTVTAAANMITEGVTPPAESLTVLDISVTVNKYGALYGYTERQEALGEDDIPAWMEEQLGERLGNVREKVYIGALQACTNRFYSGGTTRATTASPVTLNLCDRITRNLAANHSKFVRSVMSSSQNYGSQALQATYLAFGHTDLQQDIEKVPGFKAKADYGSMKVAHDLEIGCVGSLRFILSPDLPFVIDSGAAIAGTTNYSTTGTSADVYQLFVIAKDAWGHTAFRGLDAFKFNHIKPSQVDKSDPTGERGYVSATFYDAAVVTHNGWMAVAECTISALT
jgi:N4-gp56 family major capsid protein